MQNVFNDEISSRHTLSVDRGVNNENDNQDVEGLFSFAFKKLKGQSLSGQEIEIIKAYTKNNRTIRSKLTENASSYLLKDKLSSVEAELLMLLLTGVINTLDPYIENIMQSILTRSEISSLSRSIDLDGSGLSPTSVELLKDLVNNAENANNLLASISIQKSTALQKGHQSDLYKALSILELAGEVIYQATKETMEASEYQEIDGMFGRKIDMILKVETTSVELSTNEWKSMQSSDLRLTQQSKNIRSNCDILNKLQIDLGNDEQLMALDMTGDVGYIYRLQKMDDVYLASLFTSLFLPSDICQMDLFVETIVALFKWKHFMVMQSKRLKVQLARNNMDNIAGHSVRPLSPVMPKTYVIFTELPVSNQLFGSAYSVKGLGGEDYLGSLGLGGFNADGSTNYLTPTISNGGGFAQNGFQSAYGTGSQQFGMVTTGSGRFYQKRNNEKSDAEFIFGGVKLTDKIGIKLAPKSLASLSTGPNFISAPTKQADLLHASIDATYDTTDNTYKFKCCTNLSTLPT
ncbi:hypothetical protein INT47_006859 [Mucor saturninus]|uniref:Uncharacterized protein n=1 Tax=Mucor saturninus TaxID=64648 RepID=A0A8H7VAM0_9FUNG|nr:hypothetical protein INT47_006859 [Mucor saturninus]